MKSFYIFNVLPRKIKSTIWFSVLVTVIQFSLDCFLAYVITSIDELDQTYMVLFAIVAIISVISFSSSVSSFAPTFVLVNTIA